eukprot:GHRQ01024936.1.p1 GENE.GHRQ01024936.1~~GHRQ01024936.1.p1  ORF type:complete len:133 (-),score=27.88 GHRQ01024936.1:326-724(-)
MVNRVHRWAVDVLRVVGGWPSLEGVMHARPPATLREFADWRLLWTALPTEHVQVKRAKKFLDILFDHAPEKVVVVVTHSGFTRSLLLAVQREPYRCESSTACTWTRPWKVDPTHCTVTSTSTGCVLPTLSVV